jgi:hypothetical protein
MDETLARQLGGLRAYAIVIRLTGLPLSRSAAVITMADLLVRAKTGLVRRSPAVLGSGAAGNRCRGQTDALDGDELQ